MSFRLHWMILYERKGGNALLINRHKLLIWSKPNFQIQAVLNPSLDSERHTFVIQSTFCQVIALYEYL